MRIASLVGKTVSGDILNLGLAEGSTIDGLVAKRLEIMEAGGKVVKGKMEIKLCDIYLLASNTGGGELKAHKHFA